MKDIKRIFNLITLGNIALDVVFIILGIFLIYFQNSLGDTTALVLLGLVLIINGIYAMIKYIISGKVIFKFDLIYGIISLVVGLIAVYKPFAIANLISVLIGTWLIISSVFKFIVSVELRKFNENTWTFDMGVSALCIVLGILLIINPFKGFIVLSTYAAIMIMVYSAIDIVEQLFIRKRAARIIKFFK